MNRWVIAHKKMRFAFVAPPRRGSWVLASTDGPPWPGVSAPHKLPCLISIPRQRARSVGAAAAHGASRRTGRSRELNTCLSDPRGQAH